MFKKKSSKAIDATVSQSVNFELTLAQMARRSERRAWGVAFSAVALALILAGGYFYMLPLKQKVPFLIMADAATGVATVARLTDDANVERITSSEAINRSNVAHFVQARESYDAIFLSLNDWKTVQTMSTTSVARAYTNLFTSENPDNPYQIYGRERAIRIKILSIILPTKGSATVRFQRAIYDKKTGGTQPLDNKIAMLQYTYKPDLNMNEQDRLNNPLGFQVTSYRVDNDLSSPAPAETPVQSTSAAPPAAMPAEVAPPPPAAAPSAPASQTAPPAAVRKPRRTRHIRKGAHTP